MKDKVARLAYARSVVAEREASLAEAEIELHASSLWLRLENRKESLASAKTTRAIVEAEVREQALGIYEETGDKRPHPVVLIKMYTVLGYDDGEALDYARVYVPRAVKLDKRAFERTAKVLEPDFVTIRREPRATIARDLSEYLSRESTND